MLSPKTSRKRFLVDLGRSKKHIFIVKDGFTVRLYATNITNTASPNASFHIGEVVLVPRSSMICVRV